MEYFCYISRDKVDQLFHNISADADAWTEKVSTESERRANLEAGLNLASIVSLFKGGITYGQKGVIQRERQLKLSYTDKLRKVLMVLAKDSPIPELGLAIQAGKLTQPYYHYDGLFSHTAAN